ncbi:ABC transporter, substrate-binding protein [Citrifermentans bremense]|uniref:ABC transporter, substrate-binding protein n=1 Tax=Citrifermentans bremense TaxID=60035 RepID=A0A6S6M8E3_9BACT|nr:ABC transporter substrate-binding protein [Citrifermentans bremense]BCG47685.1 ABC transporter, substrate-binding protein [Citrifermentans bremense]
MKRIISLVLALALLALSGLSAQAAELHKLKVGHLPTSGHLLYFVAQEKGFFKQEGLDVQLYRFTNSGEGLTAIKTGKLDIGSFGTSAPLSFIANGADFTLFGGQMGEGHALIAKPENAARFKDLKNYRGATIGAIRLATGDVVFRAALHEAGLDWRKDLTIKEFDSPAAVQEAVKKGAVDAGLTWIPYYTMAEKQGLVAVKYSGDVIKSHTCCRQVALTSTVKARQADFDKFMVALLKAYRFYQGNRKETVDIVSKYVQIDKADLNRDIYGGHLLVSPDPHKKSIVQFWDFMKKADYVKSKEPIEPHVNTDVYARALATLVKREPKEKLWVALNKDFLAPDPSLHINKH